ncbi:MAG: c-type cytochrome [Saprospiraceae bacterium]|nr:c-type cytochrome [Saprospiraceae bacterium]
MVHKSLINRALLLLSFLTLQISVFAQDEAAINAGKALFKTNCASCHNRNMKDDLTGPALGGVEERWADYDQADLYSWIRNSQALIQAGHPRAVEVYNDWNKVAMTAFPNLTDDDVSNILAYINCTYAGNCPGQAATTSVAGGPAGGGADEGSNTGLFVVLTVILGILAIVLARIASNLNYMLKVQAGDEGAGRRSLVDILTSKGVIGFLIFALVVLGGYTTVNNAISMGRQQGYQPEQPIKFSHATHAGAQKIDCQYCHDGARRSKHSVIPAANTCMNCHKAVKVGSQYGTAELTKIYASIGYDPSSDTYIQDIESKSNDDLKAIYSKWIQNEYMKQEDAKVNKVESVVDDQWDAIVASLTNPDEGDESVYGPINWIRIHNLPDHAYFNHAQHVSVGEVECQQCHGKVEEMEIVGQYAPLSMGWCINCHRQTEVQFDGNEYYKSYSRYVEELESGARDKVTVEDIGGLECQKCHY